MKKEESTEITLIGAGIMSTTLGMLLMILEPTWKISIYERLKNPAQESSNAWNNAGTGHAAFCELNYTEYNNQNDSVDISKAISINESFELSLQFWSYLVNNKILNQPKSFINNIPHMSFVWNEDNIHFLKKRFESLQNSILFSGMKYSEDPKQIHEWAPLVIDGRKKFQKIAATYMAMGTDINFGEITQQLITTLLKKYSNFKIHLHHDVIKIQRHNHSIWKIDVIDRSNLQKKHIYSNYIFIGGGGKSINLLQTTEIQEITGYAGFPIGGQFLITKNPTITSQHHTKVYGKAPINTPPMSVPHIDARIFNDTKFLLFGPFATFSSKFLKYGSWLDLFHSLKQHNILPMLQAGLDNFELIKYTINQLFISNKKKINALQEYYPNANPIDWSLLQAGQRVQIIKTNNKNKGILQFGTEIISSNDHSLSAILGASPGASTVVEITLKILNIMFKNQIHSANWKNKIIEIIPSYSQQLNNNLELTNKIRKYTCDSLQLTYIEAKIPKNK